MREVIPFAQECHLKAGEMLFIPAFYWHQVTSIDTCISINMFFGDKYADWFNYFGIYF